MAEVAEAARRMTRASAGSGLTTIWSAALGLFTAPFLIHHLGASQYGIFALISIVSSYLTNLEFGFGHATVRFLARARAEQDSDGEAAVVGNALAIFIPGAVLAASATFFGAAFIVRHFAHGPETFHATFVHAVQLGAPIIGVAMLNTCFSAALQALGRWGFLVTSSWIVGSLLSIAAVTVVALGGGLVTVIVAQLVLNSLLALASMVALTRATSAPLFPRFRRDTFVPMAKFSVVVMFAGIASQTMIQGPPAVLAAYKTTAEVAAFGISSTVFQQLAGIVGATGLGFLPFASAASASTDRTAIQAIYTANLRLTILVLAPLITFIMVFAHPLLSVWISTPFADRAAYPLRFMVAASLILGLSSPPSDLARGFGQAKFVTTYAVLAAGAALGLSFLAVPDHGAGGAAFGLCVGMAIVTIPYVFLAGAWMIDLPPLQLARSLRGPAGGLLLVGVLYEVGLEVSDSFQSAIVTGAVGTTVYGAAAATFLLDARERRVLSSLIARTAKPEPAVSVPGGPGVPSGAAGNPTSSLPAIPEATPLTTPAEARVPVDEPRSAGSANRPWRPVLIAAGIALLGVAWTMSSQPFSGPDEGPHYLRALTIAHGHILGRKVPYQNSAENRAEVAFAAHDTRAVWVPAAKSPPGFRCLDGSRDLRGCMEATPTGDYYPLPYLLPAVTVGIASNATTGIWLARIASVLLCALMFLLAFALLWDGTGWSVIGLLGGLTPMVLFVASVLNPSGLEIASSLAFAAASLRLARSATQTPRGVWIALSVSGAVLLLSFQASPMYAALDLLLAAAFIGWRSIGAVVSARRTEAVVSALVLIAALIVWAIYSSLSGISHSKFGVTPFLPALKSSTTQMRTVLEQAIGDFGSLTVPLPGTAYALWLLFVAALIVGALAVGTRRERQLIVLAAVVAFACPVLANAWIYRHSGFALQARQVLPALFLAPLAAGEVLWRHKEQLTRSRARLVPPAAVAFALLFQLYAWFVNEENSPGGSSRPRWTPPLGHGIWIALAVLTTAALLACAAPLLSPAGQSRSRK